MKRSFQDILLKLIGPGLTLLAMAWSAAIHIAMLGDRVDDMEKYVAELERRIETAGCLDMRKIK